MYFQESKLVTRARVANDYFFGLSIMGFKKKTGQFLTPHFYIKLTKIQQGCTVDRNIITLGYLHLSSVPVLFSSETAIIRNTWVDVILNGGFP